MFFYQGKVLYWCKHKLTELVLCQLFFACKHLYQFINCVPTLELLLLASGGGGAHTQTSLALIAFLMMSHSFTNTRWDNRKVSLHSSSAHSIETTCSHQSSLGIGRKKVPLTLFPNFVPSWIMQKAATFCGEFCAFQWNHHQMISRFIWSKSFQLWWTFAL